MLLLRCVCNQMYRMVYHFFFYLTLLLSAFQTADSLIWIKKKNKKRGGRLYPRFTSVDARANAA